MIEKLEKYFKIHYFIFLLVFVSLIDSNNMMFHAKYFLFGTILFLAFLYNPRHIFSIHKTLNYILLAFILFVPVYGILVGAILKNNLSLGMPYFTGFFYFALLYAVIANEVNITKILIVNLLIVSILSIAIFVLSKIDEKIFLDVYQYMVYDKQIAIFSTRYFWNTPYLMIHFNSAPLMIFGFGYFVHKLLFEKFNISNLVYVFPIFLFLTSIIFTVSRALIFSALLIFCFEVFIFIWRKRKYLAISFLFFLISIALLILIKTNIISGLSDSSSSIKYLHLQSYYSLFTSSPHILFFGQGFGSTFFSEGFASLTNRTELTYLEILRVLGFPIFVFIMFVVLQPFFRKKSIVNSWIFFSFLVYLLVVLNSNPYLLNSNGMLILVTVYAVWLRNNETFIIKTK